ncbi:hypothetical protein D0Z70_22630 [Sphingobium terrigena]|uniref:Pr6Pr family membrane protein n=1 Tax=Sphingobium terrigena TaxID=2304063 RepID=A0A418YLB8_9SPHN|nr:Pr6Pr family membrane protein [Sphingobium terrigena]RJG51770.1 hypothetical protein D0Z70_22630 [Sphingobium terrigena]
MTARMAAAIVALVALAGLVVQFAATLDQTGSVAGTLWVLLRYFTVLTNLFVALAFGWVAIGGRPHPRRLAGVMLAILLVGIIYGLLLRGLLTLSGGALLADTLLHKVTPVLVPLWWIAFAVRGQLRWRDAWGWTLFPALYLPYALLRGMAEGRYAYPFIDVAKIGIGPVLVNAVLIAIGFVAAGHALVWIDRRMARSG